VGKEEPGTGETRSKVMSRGEVGGGRGKKKKWERFGGGRGYIRGGRYRKGEIV